MQSHYSSSQSDFVHSLEEYPSQLSLHIVFFLTSRSICSEGKIPRVCLPPTSSLLVRSLLLPRQSRPSPCQARRLNTFCLKKALQGSRIVNPSRTLRDQWLVSSRRGLDSFLGSMYATLKVTADEVLYSTSFHSLQSLAIESSDPSAHLRSSYNLGGLVCIIAMLLFEFLDQSYVFCLSFFGRQFRDLLPCTVFGFSLRELKLC
jgi:hypothetical protein